jgi:hypothetical protein
MLATPEKSEEKEGCQTKKDEKSAGVGERGNGDGETRTHA